MVATQNLKLYHRNLMVYLRIKKKQISRSSDRLKQTPVIRFFDGSTMFEFTQQLDLPWIWMPIFHFLLLGSRPICQTKQNARYIYIYYSFILMDSLIDIQSLNLSGRCTTRPLFVTCGNISPLVVEFPIVLH